MRLTRNSAGHFLPVFDACYAVIAVPTARLPAISYRHWLHCAPVDALVTGLNGIGGSLKTVRNGHVVAGALQLIGSSVKVAGGFFAYVVGNLLGKNFEFNFSEIIQ